MRLETMEALLLAMEWAARSETVALPPQICPLAGIDGGSRLATHGGAGKARYVELLLQQPLDHADVGGGGELGGPDLV